jgi:hypothetical protein
MYSTGITAKTAGSKDRYRYCIHRSQPEMSLVWPETEMSRMAGDDC